MIYLREFLAIAEASTKFDETGRKRSREERMPHFAANMDAHVTHLWGRDTKARKSYYKALGHVTGSRKKRSRADNEMKRLAGLEREFPVLKGKLGAKKAKATTDRKKADAEHDEAVVKSGQAKNNYDRVHNHVRRRQSQAQAVMGSVQPYHKYDTRHQSDERAKENLAPLRKYMGRK